jgi:hypothetical protein
MNLTLEELQGLFEIAQRGASRVEKDWLAALAKRINDDLAAQGSVAQPGPEAAPDATGK